MSHVESSSSGAVPTSQETTPIDAQSFTSPQRWNTLGFQSVLTETPPEIPRIYRGWSGAIRHGSHDLFSWTRQAKDVKGYPKLAGHMADLRGNAIFRQFSALNARNLLFLHSDILDLEETLHQIERENESSPAGVHRSMHSLRMAALKDPSSREWQQLELMKDLKVKLKEYNEFVLQLADLNRLQKPSSREVWSLRDTIAYSHEGEGADQYWIEPIEHSAWQIQDDKEFENDLVYLSYSSEHHSEPFTSFLVRCMAWLVQLRARYSAGAEGQMIDNDLVTKWTARIAVVVASTVPSISILVLYYIPSIEMRLVFIIIWSIFFSCCLTIFSSASTVQVFSASTAMAAVQVVFVGIGTP